MGIIIKWQVPDTTEANYDNVYIYRSTSKTGTYTQLATQLITDNTYFDTTGTTSSWYKIRFFRTSGSIWSDYSDPIQGGKFNGYCTVDDVRNSSKDITSTKIVDRIVFDYIKRATSRINHDILTEYRNEKIVYIGIDKQNNQDGANTTFYVQHPYIGDYNDDGIIDEDDIYAYSISASGTRTELTVSSLDDARHGQFTLSAGPSGDVEVYVTYRTSPVLLYPEVDMDVREAAICYSLMLSHSDLDSNQVKSYRVNKISVTGESSPYGRYKADYQTLVSKIVSTPLKIGKGDMIV
jgi:hypothetical protein